MHSVCCCSLPVWRRSSLKKGTPWDLFLPCPGSAPGRIWPKNNNTCEGPWVLHPNQVSSKSIERFWRRSWKCKLSNGRQTDDGQRVITIGHWRLRLLCPNNDVKYTMHQSCLRIWWYGHRKSVWRLLTSLRTLIYLLYCIVSPLLKMIKMTKNPNHHLIFAEHEYIASGQVPVYEPLALQVGHPVTDLVGEVTQSRYREVQTQVLFLQTFKQGTHRC